MTNILRHFIALSVVLLLGIVPMQADVVPQTADPTNSDTFKGWVDNRTGALSSLTITGETYSGPGSALPRAEFAYVNEVNFPDPNFRKFAKNSVTTEFYIRKDNPVSSIDIFTSADMASLEGLEFFPKLAMLDISHNPVQHLDFSKNPKLRQVWISETSLQSIEFGDDSPISFLSIYDSPLAELDLSKTPEMQSLTVENCNIAALDFGNNPKIRGLFLRGNPLTGIDLTHLENLRSLELRGNQIQTVDLSNNKALERVKLNGLQMSSIGFDDTYTGLIELEISNCQISEITGLSASITSLNLSDNQISEITGLPASLTSLNVSNNQISEITGLPERLSELIIAGNQISSLSNLPADISSIQAQDNVLTEIDVRILSKLNRMNLTNNRLTSLDVSTCERLGILDISDNPLTSLILGPRINRLTIENAPLSTLDLSATPNISDLKVNNCNLQSIDLSALTNLYKLSLNNNRLTSLNLERFSQLYWLEADNNNLSMLKLNSELEYLEHVSAANNQLETIDIPPCGYLSYLDLSNNRLEKLDVSPNTGLKTLKCSDNLLKSLTLPNQCTVGNGVMLKMISSTKHWASTGVSYSRGSSFNHTMHYEIYDGEYVENLDWTGLRELNFANNHLTSIKMHGERNIGLVCTRWINADIRNYLDFTQGGNFPGQYHYDASRFDPNNNGRHLNNVEKAYVGRDENGNDKHIFYLRLDDPRADEQHINDRVGYDFDLTKVVEWKSGGVVIDGKRNKLAPALAKRGVSQADIDHAHVEGTILLLDENNPRIVYDYNSEGFHKDAYRYSLWDYHDMWTTLNHNIPSDYVVSEESEHYPFESEYLVAPFTMNHDEDPTGTIEFYLTWNPEDNTVVTGVAKIDGKMKTIEKVSYINPVGITGTEPFEGVNIVITRYSDGTETTRKMVR